MRATMKPLAVSFGTALTIVAAYHFLVLREDPAKSRRSPDWQGVESDVASLRQDFDRFSKRTHADLDARLRALEIEGRRSAPPTSRPGAAAGPAEPATRSEPDRLAEFRSLLEEIEKTRERERDVATWRRRLKNASISLPVAQEDEFVTAAAAYQESVRDLFPGGSGGNTVAEREATLAKMEELRGALLEKLRSRIESLSAEDLEKMFPPAPTKPPERNVPEDPSAMNSR